MPSIERVPKHIQRYLPYNCVEAARERILWCYRAYDLPIISFSGGKDSLAVLLLAVETVGPLGIRPHVVFKDEEFVPTRTLEFVRWVFYDSPFAHRIIPMWGCWQMESELYCVGTSRKVIQWGAGRPEWTRQPPPQGLMDPEHVYDIYGSEAPLARLFPGRSIVSLLGVRSSESMVRMISTRRNADCRTRPCFVRATDTAGCHKAVPIYDWQTKDVLRFLAERQTINPIYYEMLCAGKRLRTDTPLHGRKCEVAAFKRIDPAFFDRICALFPEIHAAALYNPQLAPLKDRVAAAVKKYGHGWAACLSYIRAEIRDPDIRARAERFLHRAACRHGFRRTRKLSPGVPLLRVWKKLVDGQFDHKIMVDEVRDRDEQRDEDQALRAARASRMDRPRNP